MDIKEVNDHMEKSINSLQQNLLGLRTGRVTPAVLAKVHVDAYGSQMPVAQVANVSSSDGKTLVIEPWDKGLLKEIITAIQKANLGATPNSDGNLIKLPFPALSQERRNELSKLVKKNGEDAKVAIRNIRRDAVEAVKKAEKNKEISEDAKFKKDEEIQKSTDKYIKKIDEIVAVKEKEIQES